MKISKRTREQAALICAVCASTGDGCTVIAHDLGVFMPVPGDLHDLIRAAFNEAYKRPQAKDEFGIQHWKAQMAEAEALLRTGWTP